MCHGLAVITEKIDDEWKVYAKQGESSHDKVLHELRENLRYGKAPHLKFEVIFPNQVRELDRQEQIPGHGRIMPHEMGDIPDALKDIAKQAMDEHNHVHAGSSASDKYVDMMKKAGELIEKNPDPFQPGLAKTNTIELEAKTASVQLRKEDVIIPKFEFDTDKKKLFENIFFVEEPDGRVAILYGESTYCTTKPRVLGIPYPFPAKYFDPKRGWNLTVEQAVKKYRKYLAENPPKKDDPDDWKYMKILNTNTRPNLDEENVEGCLE